MTNLNQAFDAFWQASPVIRVGSDHFYALCDQYDVEPGDLEDAIWESLLEVDTTDLY